MLDHRTRPACWWMLTLCTHHAVLPCTTCARTQALVSKQIEISTNPKLVVQLEYILQQMDPDASSAAGELEDGAESEDGEEDDEPEDEDDDGGDLMMADASEGETLKEDGSAVGEMLLQRDYLHVVVLCFIVWFC